MRRFVVLVASVIVAAHAPAVAAAVSCAGMVVTVQGTPGPDVLIGTLGSDVIDGGGGDDVLLGLGGDDALCPGDGSDFIDGGRGSDTLDYGSSSEDLLVQTATFLVASLSYFDAYSSIEAINGSPFDDGMFGSPADDVLRGMGGDDVIAGNMGRDVLEGGNGNDLLKGMDGPAQVNDLADDVMRLDGGAGSDRLIAWNYARHQLLGGTGDDCIEDSWEDDLVDGGAGADVLYYGEVDDDITVDLAVVVPQNTGRGNDTILRSENIWGGSGDDVFRGNEATNIFHGNFGFNTADGRGGADICFSTDVRRNCESFATFDSYDDGTVCYLIGTF